MTGILAPDIGELSVLGKAPAEFDRSDRSRLGYMPQLSVLYSHLSIWENLGFSASLFGVPWRGRRRRMKEQLELVELDGARTRLLRESSGGMQRRLALTATLIHTRISYSWTNRPPASIQFCAGRYGTASPTSAIRAGPSLSRPSTSAKPPTAIELGSWRKGG
ncbi:MAG TPA: ATP-binding cassette domain-containing protein [Acidimicrobiia bacterium]|nr:ATP-binding cassette domain-containing protein [Acidimicrobiia bacterium]